MFSKKSVPICALESGPSWYPSGALMPFSTKPDWASASVAAGKLLFVLKKLAVLWPAAPFLPRLLESPPPTLRLLD